MSVWSKMQAHHTSVLLAGRISCLHKAQYINIKQYGSTVYVGIPQK